MNINENKQAISAAGPRLSAKEFCSRGYDVISNRFFVHEKTIGLRETKGRVRFFDDFSAYYAYLNGDIYDNACYYGLNSSFLPNTIDLKRLYSRSSLIDYNIDNITLALEKKEKEQWLQAENNKEQIKAWSKEFAECRTYSQLRRVINELQKTDLYKHTNTWKLLWVFAQNTFLKVPDKERLSVFLEYYSATGSLFAYYFITALCAMFEPSEIVSKLKCDRIAPITQKRRVQKLRKIAKHIQNGEVTYARRGFFDASTHYFFVEIRAIIKEDESGVFTYFECVDNFNDFLQIVNGDLRHCDLSSAWGINLNVLNCIIDNTTKLPINAIGKKRCTLTKQYEYGKFIVTQEWEDQNGVVLSKKEYMFNWFFDFVAFLKGDLSGADLLLCDGLINLPNVCGLNFEGALLTSKVCEKLGLEYKRFELCSPPETSFDFAEENEKKGGQALALHGDLQTFAREDDEIECSKFQRYGEIQICYISDIHFYHLLSNHHVKSQGDKLRTMHEVVNNFKNEIGLCECLLIAGDVSLDFDVFALFVKELRRAISTSVYIIFVLGNHDLWSCPNNTLDEIIEKYRDFLSVHGMYLLQNDILYIDGDEQINNISESDLKNYTPQRIRELTRTAKLAFFGGIGFAGYDKTHNASTGLYRNNNTIGYNRAFEIAETQKFEMLYNKACAALYDKNVIILTHFPIYAWHRANSTDDLNQPSYTDALLQPGFIYVNGHTHDSIYYEDGKTRIFADNQFGYNKHNRKRMPHLKAFSVSGIYDYFSDYHDGVYIISPEEYKAFYLGKHINIVLNRQLNTVYMLKKRGYYCFIHQSVQRDLCILNGGTLKRLNHNDINYYYNNMDAIIDAVKRPLDNYTEFQIKISEEIKRIGGEGRIHGCIIDVDYFNHIYVNPSDHTLTGYWASDIINKLVYPSVPDLLQARCPGIYSSYIKKLGTGAVAGLLGVPKESKKSISVRPVEYLNTDIYSASREIKKLQRLYSNIISTWPDRFADGKLIPQ